MRILIGADWSDVPHLTEAAQADLLATIAPYQRDARTKGIPALGAGAIYPVSEDSIKVDPFEIPAHWRRGYGLDVGWNTTAAVWGAYDPETETRYIYSVYGRGEAEPAIHADAIRSRGAWIPGRIDPASRGRTQTDGHQLLQMYRDLGLSLEDAENGVESGIYTVWSLLEAGKLKIFSSLREIFSEYRLYRRDEKGRLVKKNDHRMDALRYFVASGVDWLKAVPSEHAHRKFDPSRRIRSDGRRSGWMR